MFSRGVAVVGVVLAALLAPFSIAHAGPRTDLLGGGPGIFCVMFLPTGVHRCVDSPADLVRARSAVIPSRTSVEENGAVRGTNAVFHIATIWDNAGYDSKRGSYEFYAGADCTPSKGDINWQNQNLGSIGWSNRVSSFQSYGNCQTQVFAGLTFTGLIFPVGGFLTASINVGPTMNDNAESIRWS
ncbi:hypothetical protein ABIB25_005749 [Nakamurella sp. UYEF19]|uniref:hypothetical protein n=1 Tax=Nakamurella sp. UYEF19 TaxID=1756392 RepID=UPI0033989897